MDNWSALRDEIQHNDENNTVNLPTIAYLSSEDEMSRTFTSIPIDPIHIPVDAPSDLPTASFITTGDNM